MFRWIPSQLNTFNHSIRYIDAPIACGNFVRLALYNIPNVGHRMIHQQVHHEPSSFIFSRSTPQTQPVQQPNAPGQGPYVFFLPLDKLCGAPQHHHKATTPMVQIVQPAGVGRYIGVPKPAPAYLTSSSMPGNALTALPFLNSIGTTTLRNFF